MAFTTKNLYSAAQVFEAGADSVTRTTGPDPRVTWRFIIRGAESEADAHDALWQHLLTNFTDDDGNICAYDIPLDTITINTTDSDYFHEAEVVFAFTTDNDPTEAADSPNERPDDDVNSEDYEQPEVDDLDYQFSTTGGTSHITHSLQTLGVAATVPRSFDGGIGWNGDGFDGVDVITPHYEFSISVNWPRSKFNQAYRLMLANATGSINSTAWNGFAAGCVLFKGVSAAPKGLKFKTSSGERRDYYWRATYQFEANPSTSVTFKGTTLVKRGFDYLWKLWERSEAGGVSVTVSTQVNVERVYPEFDFDDLELPLPE